MKQLEVENLTVGYNKKTIIVNNASFSLERGEMAVLIGLNGSGKTTLLKTVAGLIKPYGGEVLVEGKNLLEMSERDRSKWLSYIPQRPSSPIGLTLFDVVIMGYNVHLPLFSQPGIREKERAERIIREVGLESKTHELFSSLSEGQKQLAILARALIQDSPIMLMDEPESALDINNRTLLLEIIKKILINEKKTALGTLHSPESTLRYADRIIAIKDHKIIRNITVRASRIEEIESTMKEVYGAVHLIKYGNNRYTVVADENCPT